MPETKYVTESYSTEITPIEVERSTKHTVWINQHDWFTGKVSMEQFRKKSDYKNFHDTWEQAHTYLKKKHQKNLHNLKKKLDEEVVLLTKISAMRPPEDHG